MQSVNTAPLRPLLFCDLDDVLCLNKPFGVTHVRDALYRPAEAPPYLWRLLFSNEAFSALIELLKAHEPQVVITSSWLSLLDRHHFVEVFTRTGLELLATNLHDHWDAPTKYGESRLEAIDAWLEAHHVGEPVLILDDYASGESLIDSFHHEAGRALLCRAGKGFHSGMLADANSALQTRYSRVEPWKP